MPNKSITSKWNIIYFFSDFINLHVQPPLNVGMFDSYERYGASRFWIGSEILSVENVAAPYNTDDLLKCSNDIKKYKKTPSQMWRGSKKATTYSPTNGSTICAIGLNFSVRDGKRWAPMQ